MKNLKLGISALALTVASTVFAQTTSNPWVIGVGAHAENYLAQQNNFSNTWSAYNITKRVFRVANYTITPPLSKLTVARNLNKYFVLDWQTTVGNVDNKRFATSKEFFLQTGLGLQFKAASLWGKEDSWFDPYLRVGANYLRHDYSGLTFPRNDVYGNSYAYYNDKDLTGKANHFTLAGGAGLNVWLTKNFGLNAQGDYVTTPGDKSAVSNFFQASASLLFRFGAKDTDKDGLLDKDDACPTVAGPIENKGCPWPDTDGDGILDKDDKCPTAAGPAENGGCPWEDKDGDGVLDKDDKCPTVAGPVENQGCPWPDTDGDGILDKDDACPTVPGIPENKGCPSVKDSATTALKGIFFNFNKATIKPDSEPALKAASEIIKASGENFVLVGMTDKKGKDEYNLKLSKARANAVMSALENKGVPSDRLKSIGIGEQEATVPETASDAARQVDRKVIVRAVSGADWAVYKKTDYEAINPKTGVVKKKVTKKVKPVIRKKK